MKEQINILIKLQKIESEAAEVSAMLKSVSEKIKNVDLQRETFEQAIIDRTVLIEDLTKKYRSFEADAAQNQAQVEKSREKLRSVKTNKEYQSSLKEIEDLKARNAQIEDEMLEHLDQIDGLEKTLAEEKTSFQHLSIELEDEKRSIEQAAAKDKARLARLVADKNEVAGSLDKAMLDVFLTVRKKRTTGVAIVPVVEAACQGCNVNIPPQMYNEMQRCNQLHFCPNCQRIIYWDQC